MTEAAISSLSDSDCDQGFYLQVEAGRVDHANHAGNLYRTVTDGQGVRGMPWPKRYAERTNAAEETLIVGQTADHEHALAFNGYCGRGSSIIGLCREIDDETAPTMPITNLPPTD
ncbi:MAG: hypothetical protein AcusKO_42980 [Acuticoccus sp.]